MGKSTTYAPSALDKVHLAFEYDVSWRDAKKAVRMRSHKQ